MTVEHWFDFICPYCYVAQDRNRILRERGLHLVEQGLAIHPEIPPGGTPAGPRSGPAYDFLAAEAAAAGLPLRWPDRIGYSRPALAAYEWLRLADPGTAGRFASAVFAGYFAKGRDIESVDGLVSLADRLGADGAGLRAALGGEADEALARSTARARAYGVLSTPTWVAGGRRVSGLRPRQWFEEWNPAG